MYYILFIIMHASLGSETLSEVRNKMFLPGGNRMKRRQIEPGVQEASEDVVMQEFPHGVRGQRLKLISDNGCQPSSRSFLNVTATLNIEPAVKLATPPRLLLRTKVRAALAWLRAVPCRSRP